ncbi:MAG TPA: InlB B-repeat-containing protein, partial [Clostridia bacterium]|nr:InlB B-repeat-containing protein [Clostridia bacterium]
MRKKNIVIFATAILLLISLLVACNGEADVNLTFIVDGEVYETIDRSNVEVTLPQNPIKEGYTFNGWYAADNIFPNGDTPTTIPSGDLVFYAKWTLNQYTISFVSNGGSEVLAIIQDYGTDVLAPVEPIREGYTFNGWFADNNTFLNEYTFTTIPSNDLTLYAKWTINNYTISFNANGGSEVDSITKEYGTALPAFDNPIKDYHTFSGWYTDNQTFESEFTFSTMPAQNITLYAKWTAYKYTLSFVTNGGSEVDSITKDYGTNVISPVEPTKEGYTFKGWFIDNNTFLNEYTFTTIPSNNVELYAKWTINNYTISFNANDGSEVDSITQDYGTEVVAPTCQKEGYSLDGWYDETLTTKYDFTTMPADDFTLYAKWTINKYIISFVANGGSEVDSISKDYGQDVVAPTNPQKEGYTFNGWYTDNGTFSNGYTFTTIPSKNVELYAKWTINEYTLSFNANGGSEVDSITQDYDTELPALNNPNKDYHTFSGWYTDNNTFRNGFTYRNMPAQNITLYAKWEANTYTLSFDTNCDSEIVAITKAYGAALAAPVSPIREGYRLDGWYDEALTTKYDFTTMPAYNFTLYAKWTINEYTLSFNANGGSEVDSITQDYDTALPAFNDSSKDYHTFNGWYTDNGTFESGFTFSAMPAKNITLYAKWAPNKYNVVFYFWNELEQVYKQEDEIEVTYQEEISISQFSKEGYSIDLICKVGDETRAWDSNAIMPGYDLEVYGNYIINQYTILFNSRGGSIIPSIKQDYGTQVVAPTDPTKTGHTFSGWYTDNNSFENEYIFTTIPASKVTLYAKWTVNQYTVS